MDKDLKDNLKKIAKDGELWVTRSILKWKYKREGKEVPQEAVLDEKGKQVAKEARDIISKRGKNILNEIKHIYKNGTSRRKDT